MGKIVEMRLDENTTFFAEVADDKVEWLESSPDQQEGEPLYRGGRTGTLTERVSTSVVEALKTVQPVVDRVVESFRASDPSECRVSFGLKLHGKVGVAIFSEGGAEAQLKVTLRWRKPKTKKKGLKGRSSSTSSSLATKPQT